ncbi:MAG: autotransporter-associated beta strand repeat-containing protein [Chloroflexi bacterium]|nr:autotransporter-associated beta strand repeat-containing protein [Chloroflexota bacterium]
MSSSFAQVWNLNADGNWNVDGNWSPAPFPNAEGAAAVLGFVITADRIITLGQDITVGELSIADDNSYTVTGNTLIFDSVGSFPAILSVGKTGSPGISSDLSMTDALLIKQNSTGILTLSGVISGSVGLTHEGSSTTVFSGNNTYSGLTTVGGGVLNIQHANALGSTANGTVVSSGAALELQGGITAAAGESLTISGSGISNNGALRNISGNNTWAGSTTLGAAATIGADSGTTLTLSGSINNSGNALTLAGAGNFTVSGAISGSGGLTKNGAGTATLSAANTLSGAATINAGTLTLSGSGTATSVTGFTVNSGAVLTLNNAVSNNGDRIGDAATLTLDGGSVNFIGNTADSTETAGALTLSGGANAVNVQRANNSSFAVLTLSSLTRNAGATVNFLNAAGGGTLGSAGDNPRLIFSTAPTLDDGIIGGWATRGLEFATYGTDGVIALGTYDTGAQTGWTSTDNAKPGGDRTLTANRNINSLNLTSGKDVDLGGFTLNIESGGVIKSGGTQSIISNGTLTAGGTSAGELITHVDTSRTLTISAVIADNSGPGVVGVTKAGAGTLTLSGINTYTGNTIINDGILVMSERRALGTGNLILDGTGAELQANFNNSANASVANITINNGTIRRTDSSGTKSGFLSSSTTLTVNGAGTLIDQGGDGSGGFLTIDGPIVVNNGGTLTLNASTANDEVRLGGNQSITVAAGGTIVTTGSGTKSFGSGSARNIIGQGTATSEATITLGDNTTANASTSFTVNGSGTGGLRIEGTQANVDALVTAARLQGLAGSGGTFTIAYTDNGSRTISDDPSSGSNVKLGLDSSGGSAPIYTLGAADNDLAKYNGLVVKGGTVVVGKNQSFTGAGTTTLDLLGGTLQIHSGTGSRTLEFEGQATLAGGTLLGTVAGGGLSGTLKVGGDLHSDGATLFNSPNITMSPSSGTTVVDGSVPLTGIGNFTKESGGTVRLDQQISVNTGKLIDVTGGTLLLGASDRIGNDDNMRLGIGTTFDTGGYNETLGTLTLSGNSILDFGDGASATQTTLNFAASSDLWSTFTLTINDYRDFGTSEDFLYFGSDSSGLTSGQLANITWNNPFGDGSTIYGAYIDTAGRVRPVPEPATIFALVLLGLPLVCRERKALLGLMAGFFTVRSRSF